MSSVPAEKLTPLHFQKCPVWTFLNNDARGETMVKPLSKLPVRDLDGCLIGTQVTLANGQKVDALIGNIKSRDAKRTQLAITVALFKGAQKFDLDRRFDPDYSRCGPAALSRFLNLTVNEVFPISYDLTEFSEGTIEALKGKIENAPKLVLEPEQLLELLFG
jgi:hypothetical protein